MAREKWKVQFAKPSPGWRKAKILLPDEATRDSWPRPTKRMFRLVMRRPGWVWHGSKVRRKINTPTGPGTEWSQHSWPGQAHDFEPPPRNVAGKRLSREEQQRRGDNMVRILRILWPREFRFVWEQPGSRALHRNGSPIHIHAEHRPKKSGVPPK